MVNSGRDDQAQAVFLMSFGRGSRAASWIFSTFLAVVLLYFALRDVNSAQVGRSIAAANGATSRRPRPSQRAYFLRSLRWRILLNAEASLDIRTAFHANMAGYIGNNFLPVRAGELIRTFLISSQSALSTTYVLTTAIGERLTDLIALVLWSSLILLRMDTKPQWMSDLSRITALFAATGALGIALLPRAGDLLEAFLRRAPLPHDLRKRLLRSVDQVRLAIRAFHDLRRLFVYTLATLAVWLLDAYAAVLGLRAFHVNVPLSVALLLLTGLGLCIALPSTPGYVGIYQFVAVTVLTPFGISQDSALAYILASQSMGYAIVLLLGLPGLFQIRHAASRFAVFRAPCRQEPPGHEHSKA